jgi:hypothetical protein
MHDVESPQPHIISEAQARFDTCRWARSAGADSPAHCAHAEVLPFAGKNGFTPESWCPGCAFYKVKRKAARPSEG